MMSGNRQRLTGRVIQNFLIWGLGAVVIWWLPVFVFHYWPSLTLEYKEPWLLDLSDLTWRRVMVNMAAKPGFRAVWVLLWSIGWMLLLSTASLRKKESRLQWKQKLSEIRFRSSMEWVMDGKRMSAIKEYARLVRVI